MPDRVRLTEPVRDARLLAMEPRANTLDVVLRAQCERAHDHGVAEGRILERTEVAGRLDAACEQVVALRETAEQELTGASIELALTIARTLLQKEIACENHDIEKIVRETLAEANVGRKPCVVHVNPADHARLEGVPFRSGTTIELDHDVPAGDVHVETSLGLLVRETIGALEPIGRKLREELT